MYDRLNTQQNIVKIISFTHTHTQLDESENLVYLFYMYLYYNL